MLWTRERSGYRCWLLLGQSQAQAGAGSTSRNFPFPETLINIWPVVKVWSNESYLKSHQERSYYSMKEANDSLNTSVALKRVKVPVGDSCLLLSHPYKGRHAKKGKWHLSIRRTALISQIQQWILGGPPGIPGSHFLENHIYMINRNLNIYFMNPTNSEICIWSNWTAPTLQKAKLENIRLLKFTGARKWHQENFTSGFCPICVLATIWHRNLKWIYASAYK